MDIWWEEMEIWKLLWLFYGIKGLGKLPDFKIVYYLIVIAVVAGILQLIFVVWV